ncbi:MAG: hypothetical protein IH933_03565 [Euryarchaeota archaeon]|nr:hypothetical protein [Euryarchaeota archaeon]
MFLVDRANLQSKRLHDRIKHRLRASSLTYSDAAPIRGKPGPYRVVGEVDPREFLEDENYPTGTARIEIEFQLRTDDPHEYYWFNWIEPDRRTLVGWHQEETHDEFGPVHRQVNDGSVAVDHEPARFIDAHPLDVVSRRLETLSELVCAVEWDGGRPVRFDCYRDSR